MTNMKTCKDLSANIVKKNLALLENYKVTLDTTMKKIKPMIVTNVTNAYHHWSSISQILRSKLVEIIGESWVVNLGRSQQKRQQPCPNHHQPWGIDHDDADHDHDDADHDHNDGNDDHEEEDCHKFPLSLPTTEWQAHPHPSMPLNNSHGDIIFEHSHLWEQWTLNIPYEEHPPSPWKQWLSGEVSGQERCPTRE